MIDRKSFINRSKCGRSGNVGLFLDFLCVCFEFIYRSNLCLCSPRHQAVLCLSKSFQGESFLVPWRKVSEEYRIFVKNGRMNRG